MKDKRPDLMPLDRVESDMVRVSLPLEAVDPSRLGMRVKDVERLLKFSGIRALNVIGDSEGVDGVPMVASVDKKGQATMAFDLATDDVDSLEINSKPPEGGFKARRLADVNLHIDLEKLKGMAGNLEAGVRSPEVWANLLDQELKKLLKSAGKECLVATEKEDVLLDSVFGASTLLSFAVNYPELDVGTALIGLFLLKFCSVFGNSLRFRGEDSRYRWSLLNVGGCEIDRYLALDVIGLYRGLCNKRLIEVIE